MFLLCCHGRKNVRPAMRMLDVRADNNNNNNNNNNIQLYLSRVAHDGINTDKLVALKKKIRNKHKYK